jgi:hypothetical protein
MKKFIVSASFVMSFAAFSAFGASMTGLVGDAMCGAKHGAASEKDVACAARCVKGGSAPVLIVGDKVYKISNPDTLAAKAGTKVTVEATVDGDTITVSKVN